jgi:tRNA nucleotidyltransferase (CCA-adding enzyme)
MRIILTHEQADFDAIASLLAANLLDENAYPILPHRLNRNVKAFITIYGAELPFIEHRDLPMEPVEAVLLVDTQSMATVRGVSSETEVNVIDHHPIREDLPEGWNYSCELIGATTTLLVEAFRRQNGHLNHIYATLMLLGIYEDTGSLTYARTTSRDLQSAAYLLEQGASLRIAADFLNHPLSLGQQKLYDALRSAVEMLKINGHTIVVAQGDATGIDEELSTIVHKLRDLLDPDALFVVMQTRSGIQMIARSTSDHINVGEISMLFGGGGHDRAAAALIKERQADDVTADLIKILPEYVLPAITVAQIMSRGPQLLSPETSIAEAAVRMQRYGYEGYPVVQAGKVIGLLTRRAVDRAIAHKLNLTAASVMNAGEVIVGPDDSIENLQRLMTDTGWGQVPVVQPESGEIIGIVTRTDLLKTLAPQSTLTKQINLSERLDAILPMERLTLLKAVAELAHERKLALYIVGGFVRDILLDRPSLDFDLVVEGDAIGLARALARIYGGRITTHATFGTAKWYIADNLSVRDGKLERGSTAASVGQLELPVYIDLISARTEFYTHPTALPTVEVGSIKLDLHRRDFTINTLALRLDGHHYGELHDYWGGLNDLRQKLVRVLHSLSFVDDPTRMIRAVRFEQRFSFSVEERSLDLMKEALPLIARVSGDRLRHELDHVFIEQNASAMLSRLDELGLLKAIHPALVWDSWLENYYSTMKSGNIRPGWESVFQDYPSAKMDVVFLKLMYMLWLIRLPVEIASAVTTRLKIARNLAGDILATCRLWKELPDLIGKKPSLITNHLNEAPPYGIYLCAHITHSPEISDLLRSYQMEWRELSIFTDGYELRRRGIPTGPVYRLILGQLKDAWLDGLIHKKEEEISLLDELMEKHHGSANLQQG